MAVKTRNLKQKTLISATPSEVYKALATSKGHAAFTGEPAKVSEKVCGKVTAYSGYSEAVNLVLKPGKMIAQSWRASDWPEGHFSKVVFELKAAKGGTALTFTQTGIPAAQFDDIKQGWKDFYWDKLKEYFKKA